MRFGMFQRPDRCGMIVLVPMLQAPSVEAQDRHGPLESIGAVDAEHEAGIDWGSVKYELDIYGYATLPGNALLPSDLPRTQRAQSQ